MPPETKKSGLAPVTLLWAAIWQTTLFLPLYGMKSPLMKPGTESTPE